MFPRNCREGRRLTKPTAQAGGFSSPGNESRAQTRYDQAKATKCGRRGIRESEHCIVLLKQGNLPTGPCGGKVVPDPWN